MFGLRTKRLSRLVPLLKASDRDVRIDALNSLQSVAQTGLSKQEGIYLLKAAPERYESAKYEWQDTSAAILDMVFEKPYPEYYQQAEQMFGLYSTEAQNRFLQLIMKRVSRESLETTLRIMNKHYMTITWFPFSLIENPEDYQDLLYPTVLGYVDNADLQSGIYLLLIQLMGRAAINPEMSDSFVSVAIRNLTDLRSKVMSIQEMNSGTSWIWNDEEYPMLRHQTGVLLDFLGYIDRPEIRLELQRAMAFKDNRLRCFACMSLLRLSETVDPDVIADIAVDGETRNVLYGGLASLGKSYLFPAAQEKQELFAESDMINWLTYPTELGRVPDEIELVQVFTDTNDLQNGPRDFYLFRFRSSHPDWIDSGWMSGLSGPFTRNESPWLNALGSTFSTFSAWESKTPVEHFEEIYGIVGG